MLIFLYFISLNGEMVASNDECICVTNYRPFRLSPIESNTIETPLFFVTGEYIYI
jgi:hypothetical protein